MKRDEIRKLLGGYATGTLTEAEREALFAESLKDQALFDALADEEALRELLDDPAYRSELAAALADTEPSTRERLAAWWKRPLPLALAGAAAALALALVIVLQPEGPAPDVAMMKKADVPAAQTVAPPPPPAASRAPQEAAVEPPGIAALEAKTGDLGQDRPALSREDAAGAESVEGAPPPAVQALRQEADSAPASEPAGIGGVAEPQVGRLVAGADEAQARAKEEAPEKRRAQAAVVSAEAEQTTVAAPAPASPLALGFRSAIGLTATVERQSADGTFVPPPAGARLDRGDAVRLRVRAPANGYVYVREQRSDGGWRLIFTGEARTGAPFYVPPAGGLAPHPGGDERRLEVLFSPSPLAVDSLEGGSALPSDDELQRANVVIQYQR